MPDMCLCALCFACFVLCVLVLCMWERMHCADRLHAQSCGVWCCTFYVCVLCLVCLLCTCVLVCFRTRACTCVFFMQWLINSTVLRGIGLLRGLQATRGRPVVSRGRHACQWHCVDVRQWLCRWRACTVSGATFFFLLLGMFFEVSYQHLKYFGLLFLFMLLFFSLVLALLFFLVFLLSHLLIFFLLCVCRVAGPMSTNTLALRIKSTLLNKKANKHS